MRRVLAIPGKAITPLYLALAILAAVAGCSSGSGGGPATYSVIYSANGATGGSVPTDAAGYRSGQTARARGNTGRLVKTGDAFVGWNTAPDGSGVRYRPSDGFAIGSGDLVLYAEWEEALVSFLRSEGDEYPVYVMRQDGTGTPTLVSPATGVFDYPTLSPFQDAVLFLESNSGKIYLVGIGNAGAALLPPLVEIPGVSTRIYFPSFSKDGTEIAFAVSAPAEDLAGVYIADAATGDYAKLANAQPNATHPSWSPDGSRIVYEADGNLYTISARDPSDAPHLLTPGCFPTWSPTGDRIAFEGDGMDSINVISPGDTGPTELIATAAGDFNCPDYWSADGALVVIDRYVDATGDSDIFSVRVSDKALENITDNPDDDEFCNNG
jgi:uncharacterized repeat protein (TIGR02543 family)